MATRLRRVVVVVAIGMAICVVEVASAAAPTLPTNLFDPRGIAVGPADALFVAESGSGRITQIRTRGNQSISTFATLPTMSSDLGDLGPVDVAVSGLGKTYVLLSGPRQSGATPFAQLVRLQPAGGSSVVADIGVYEQTHLDPYDLDNPPFPEESNPNGLALLAGNQILVADAANNSLLHVDAQGGITTVARFKPENVPWPTGLSFGPPAGTPVPAESVPTAIAVGPDGAWYVSELKGFPFTKGTSRIWRIEPGSVGVTCDPEQPQSGACRTVGTGFSSVIDLTFGADGTMYVLEIAKEGLVDVILRGGPPIGALWAVRNGSKTEIAPGSLLFPGGVAVGSDGSLYVTTGAVFGPDAGAVVRVTG